jgi:hypothetical protein
MTRSNVATAEPIRLVFELDRADNLRLYDDLIQFKKGTKRVNRLRTLAHEGLLAQHWPSRGSEPSETRRRDAPYALAANASITNQVFDEPLAE